MTLMICPILMSDNFVITDDSSPFKCFVSNIWRENRYLFNYRKCAFSPFVEAVWKIRRFTSSCLKYCISKSICYRISWLFLKIIFVLSQLYRPSTDVRIALMVFSIDPWLKNLVMVLAVTVSHYSISSHLSSYKAIFSDIEKNFSFLMFLYLYCAYFVCLNACIRQVRSFSY